MFRPFQNCELFQLTLVKTWDGEGRCLERDYIQESANAKNYFGNKFYKLS